MAKADTQGYYLIPSLLPGAYRLRVSYSGFTDYIVDSLPVEVGQIAGCCAGGRGRDHAGAGR